jgi:hypothetical protein
MKERAGEGYLLNELGVEAVLLLPFLLVGAMAVN